MFESIVDELAIIGSLLHDDDLVVYILSELGSKYKETTVVVRARDTAISFKELHDKVMEGKKIRKRPTP